MFYRTASEDLPLCRTIYNMCTQKPPHDYSEQLYTRYRDSFTQYIIDKVGLMVPALFLLRSLWQSPTWAAQEC